MEKICKVEGATVAKGVIPLVVRASGGAFERQTQGVIGLNVEGHVLLQVLIRARENARDRIDDDHDGLLAILGFDLNLDRLN